MGRGAERDAAVLSVSTDSTAASLSAPLPITRSQ